LIRRTLPLLAALLGTGIAHAQAPDPLENFIARALERSPKVRAAREVVEAMRLGHASVRSGANPRVELAPGLGFTNGNLTLSQEFDLFGSRAARSRVAEAEARLAETRWLVARLDQADRVLADLVALEAATELAKAARESADLARELLAIVEKRAEIGEVPRLQVTRAELEVLRAAQAARRHAAEQSSREAALRSLVGPEAVASIPPLDLGDRAARAKGMPARSPETLTLAVAVEVATAQARAVAASGRPSLTAGVASDVWSLDRRAMTSSNLGFQVFLSAPLFDRGENRNAVAAARAEAKAAESELAEAQRTADLAKEVALARLQAAEATLGAYRTDALPKAEALLSAMREGYKAGLVTLVEVIEAQQTLADLRRERAEALLGVREAELALLTATLALPGVGVPR
jgi:cobalt-zinc-cadmium efflux system outer membrane protein